MIEHKLLDDNGHVICENCDACECQGGLEQDCLKNLVV